MGGALDPFKMADDLYWKEESRMVRYIIISVLRVTHMFIRSFVCAQEFVCRVARCLRKTGHSLIQCMSSLLMHCKEPDNNHINSAPAAAHLARKL